MLNHFDKRVCKSSHSGSFNGAADAGCESPAFQGYEVEKLKSLKAEVK
jgi:hypothetical protein